MILSYIIMNIMIYMLYWITWFNMSYDVCIKVVYYIHSFLSHWRPLFIMMSPSLQLILILLLFFSPLLTSLPFPPPLYLLFIHSFSLLLFVVPSLLCFFWSFLSFFLSLLLFILLFSVSLLCRTLYLPHSLFFSLSTSRSTHMTHTLLFLVLSRA